VSKVAQYDEKTGTIRINASTAWRFGSRAGGFWRGGGGFGLVYTSAAVAGTEDFNALLNHEIIHAYTLNANLAKEKTTQEAYTDYFASRVNAGYENNGAGGVSQNGDKLVGVRGAADEMKNSVVSGESGGGTNAGNNAGGNNKANNGAAGANAGNFANANSQNANFASGTNLQNGEANANSQNVNFGTGTSFANAVNSANTMQSGDGIYDLTIQEARQYQSELAKNGINSVITTNPNDRSDYLVTASQSAAFAAMSLDTNSEQAIEQSREIMEEALLLGFGGYGVVRGSVWLGLKTGVIQTAEYSVAGAVGGAFSDVLTQSRDQIIDQMLSGSINFSNINIDYRSVVFSAITGGAVLPSLIDSAKTIKKSGTVLVKNYQDWQKAKSESKATKELKKFNKNLNTIFQHGSFQGANYIFTDTASDLILE